MEHNYSIKEIEKFFLLNYEKLRKLPNEILKISKVDYHEGDEEHEPEEYHSSMSGLLYKVQLNGGQPIYLGEFYHLEDAPNWAQAESYTTWTCHDEDWRQMTDKERNKWFKNIQDILKNNSDG